MGARKRNFNRSGGGNKFKGVVGELPALRRSARNVRKKPAQKVVHALATYDSPLKFLNTNHGNSPSNSTTSIKEVVDNSNSEEVPEEVADCSTSKDVPDKVSDNSTSKEVSDIVVQKEVLEEVLKKEVLEEVVKEESVDEVTKKVPEDELKVAELSLSSVILSTTKKEEQEEIKSKCDDQTDDSDIINSSIDNNKQPNARKNRKRQSIHQLIWAKSKVRRSSKNKLKKNQRSRYFTKPDDAMDSVIIVEDSDNERCSDGENSENDQKTNICLEKTVNDSIIVTGMIGSSTPIVHPEAVKKGGDTNRDDSLLPSRMDAVKDDNEVSLTSEMNAYHDKFNQTSNSESQQPICSDSVIILDPDEESPVEESNSSSKKESTQEQLSKTNEDILVVWSSMPQPSTSTVNTFCKAKTSFDSKSDLLKQDKILLDTSPNMSNYRFLNNENNKPKKKIMKSPRNSMKGIRDLHPKSILECSRVMANTKKTAAEVAAKAKSTATLVAKKIVPKSATKATTKKDLKRKAKISEDLIFLSDTQDTEVETKKALKGKPREIVIDGSNIGMAYNNHKSYSEKGIKMLIDYFTKKGHTVKVFIPQHRRSRAFPLLEKWYRDGIVVFTPSRKIGKKSYTPYDDRYILEYAIACDGIVVSQDQFRDLYTEKPQYKDVIENRILVPTFVGDYVMFPEDPLGRNGPNLADFLKH